MDVGIVILSGGENRRFQIDSIRRNKALEVVNGKRMIEWIIDSAYQVSDSVSVVVRDREQAELYSNLFSEKYPNLFVIADIEGIGHSPLIGLTTGARAIKRDLILVLPCDTPYIKANMLRMLIEKAVDFDAVTPLWPDGKIEPLMAVYKREHILLCSPALLNLKRWRPSDLIRSSTKSYMMNVENMRILDPELISFFNINYPKDLDDSKGGMLRNGYMREDKVIYPNQISIKIVKEVIKYISATDIDIGLIDSMKKAPFWLALFITSFLKRDKKWSSLAGGYFEIEADYYVKEEVNMLALHAILDALSCWQKISSIEDIKRTSTRAEGLKSSLSIDFEGRLNVTKDISKKGLKEKL
ncbi:MAG: molybdenum cofactor guanylyltransferase [Candidatus Methylarchaceae archaeon HK01M]|nr:molybdenum cofactor guanylyltransferase [Candidatus Methylarchaceae archaeon HK01M]